MSHVTAVMAQTLKAKLQKDRAETEMAQAALHPPPTIDAIVHDHVFYANVCEEQSTVFREHVEEFTKEYALYSQSADAVKSGQDWKPSPADRDAYIAEMARRCQIVPESIAE